MMAKRVIGVDVGTNAVRAAEMVVGDRPSLYRFGQVSLPVGAVHEGEVVDTAAVSAALRRLWKEVGFGNRSVRVGLASARVILRIVDVPELNDADTRSALALQLDEYVPIRIEDTVFDFQPLPPSDDPELGRRVLLAAAHQDAVRPLVDAVRGAGLRVAAVDVVPAALARAFHDHRPDPGHVDVVVSIGGGTIVVVAAREGLPMFARTITNVSGRSITERIAARLAVSDVDAERYKRGDHLDSVQADVARTAAEPAIAELVEEIRDSLDFFGAQPGALPIRRVLLTGGGALLADLEHDLALRLGLPVGFADPFGPDADVPMGFDRSDLPFLAPYGDGHRAGRHRARRTDAGPHAGGRPRAFDPPPPARDRRLGVGPAAGDGGDVRATARHDRRRGGTGRSAHGRGRARTAAGGRCRQRAGR
jgi:type IV pilus assembly protein PilM